MKTIEEEFPTEGHWITDHQLTDAYTRLRARAVELERAQQWRPIVEAPKGALDEHGEDMLFDLWAGGERYPNCWWHVFPMGGEGDWVITKHADGSFTCIENPTHFRPLPPAPDTHQP